MGLQKLKVPKLSKRKQDAREQADAEKADDAKRARERERLAAQPLGRGHRHAGTQLAVDNEGNVCAVVPAAVPAPAAGDQ